MYCLCTHGALSSDRAVDRTAWQLSQAMTRLQAEVFVFEDRLELRGALEIDAPLVEAGTNGNAITQDLYQALGDARTLQDTTGTSGR